MTEKQYDYAEILNGTKRERKHVIKATEKVVNKARWHTAGLSQELKNAIEASVIMNCIEDILNGYPDHVSLKILKRLEEIMVARLKGD